jgi:hypothetical protein
VDGIYFHPASLGDPAWAYDDPSGVPEPELVVALPEPLAGGVRAEAARRGTSPDRWLLELVQRSLRPIRPTAA